MGILRRESLLLCGYSYAKIECGYIGILLLARSHGALQRQFEHHSFDNEQRGL